MLSNMSTRPFKIERMCSGPKIANFDFQCKFVEFKFKPAMGLRCCSSHNEAFSINSSHFKLLLKNTSHDTVKLDGFDYESSLAGFV